MSTTPSSPSHANWNTSPLIPRKSPERLNKRLALGHKATQSLNIEPVDFRSILEQPITPESRSKFLSGSPLSTNRSGKVNEDAHIICPRPRRFTDLRALETSQLSLPTTPEQTSNSKHGSTASLGGSERISRSSLMLPQGQTELTPIRRHVRGARSLSPQRHQRLLSQSSDLPNTFTPLRSAGVSELRGSPSILDAGLMRTRTPDDLSKPLHRMRLEQSPIEHMKKDFSPRATTPTKDVLHTSSSPLTAPRPPSPVPRSIPCPARPENELEQQLRKARSFVLYCGQPEIELDWARDILRLTDRKQARQHMITSGQSTALPRALFELQQEALQLISVHAQKSVPRAQMMLAIILESGKHGMKTDRKEAFRLLKEASAASCHRATYRLGMQFEKLGDSSKACEYYELGAANDDVACLYRLGLMSLLGQNAYTVDISKGVSCVGLSALNADLDAPQGAYLWALMLAGETHFRIPDSVLTRDTHESVIFFEKAAALGSRAAQLRLGKAHEFNELDCEFNPTLSMHYYMLAAQGGEAEADLAVSKWFLAGSDDGAIQKDEKMSFQHAAYAAKRGFASAEFALGYFYEVGVACEPNLQTAHSLYTRAAAHGSEEAKARLEGLSRNATLSRTDHEYNVTTKIQARHATIKLNQKQAARYRARQLETRSFMETGVMPSPLQAPKDSCEAEARLDAMQTSHDQNGEVQVKNALPGADVEDLQVSERPSPAVNHQLSAPTIEVPASEMKPQLTPEARSQSRLDPPETLDSGLDTPRGHRRGQSFAYESPRLHRQGLRTVETQTLPGSNSPMASPLQHTHSISNDLSRVDQWNDEIASHSAQGSPNLAPSELGSVHDNYTLSSPRPESSVSNIPPFVPSQQFEKRHNSNNCSSLSQQAPYTLHDSSVITASSSTSLSGTSSKRAGAATFEEMGIPLANKKKEDCMIM